MKTFKDFLERAQSDEEFVNNFNELVSKRTEAEGQEDPYGIVIAVAADLGYEITREELEEQESAASELSEEELGQISGGTAIAAATCLVIGVTAATGVFSFFKAVSVDDEW